MIVCFLEDNIYLILNGFLGVFFIIKFLKWRFKNVVIISEDYVLGYFLIIVLMWWDIFGILIRKINVVYKR